MSGINRRDRGRARSRRGQARSPFGRWIVMGAAGSFAAGCGPEQPIDPPQLAGDSRVEYPIELWDARVEGETILMLHVTEDGAVDSAYVDRTSGMEDFDSAAIRGARTMRFTPAMQGTRRRSMWTRLPIRFRLEATESGGVTPLPTNDTAR